MFVRSLRRLGHFLLGVVAVLVILELLFRILPTSTSTRTGYYIDPNIQTYPAHHAFRTSFGWDLERSQAQHANNLGFLAEHDFVPDPRAVALIGDSYVEASMLDMRQRLAAQLETRIGGAPVYAMGGPGSSLLDYVERIRFAHERFGSRTFVIVVERGDVMQALCGSGNVHAMCLDRSTLAPQTQRIASDRRPLTEWLRASALAQYLNSQLRVQADALLEKAIGGFRQVIGSVRPRAATPAAARPDEGLRERQIDAVVDTFFARLQPYRDSRFVLVLGCDLNALRTRPAPPPEASIAQLGVAARSWGAAVVDTELLFRRHLEQGGLSLAVSPRDAHWNRIALGLVADEVGKRLAEPR